MGIVSQKLMAERRKVMSLYDRVHIAYPQFDGVRSTDFTPLEVHLYNDYGIKINVHRFLYYKGELVSVIRLMKLLERELQYQDIWISDFNEKTITFGYTHDVVDESNTDKWNPKFITKVDYIKLKHPADFDIECAFTLKMKPIPRTPPVNINTEV